MQIIRILKKNSTKCFVKLDNENEYIFTTDIVLEFKLFKGMHIDETLLETIKNKQSLIDAKQYAYNFAAYKPRTEAQVLAKLDEKHFSKEIQFQVLEFLKEFKLIDDEKFAENFIINYLKFKGAGKIKLRLELKKRGIKSEYIEKALIINFPDDDDEIIKKSAEKYLNKISYKPQEKQISSLRNYLLRQGFSYNSINSIISIYFDNNNKDF